MSEFPRPKAAEFFAGIGLAREGLRRGGVDVTWSNDLSPKKAYIYERIFGSGSTHELVLGDVRNVRASDLPVPFDIAWSSFPCTDLSVAGTRAGLAGVASSAFWPFIKVIAELADNRPPILVLENVHGFAVGANGEDLRTAIRALNDIGYSVDVLTINALHFLPQSRPRLFLIAVKLESETAKNHVVEVDESLRPAWLLRILSDPSLKTHAFDLPKLPALKTNGFTNIATESDGLDPQWWTDVQVSAFLHSLSPLQSSRLTVLMHGDLTQYRTAYRRMRSGSATWEVRREDVAGCLRASQGGSSRQAVVRTGQGSVSIRWMMPWEYSALMGMPEFDFRDLSPSLVQAAFGDAVAVPVVEWLTINYILPVISAP